MLDLKGQNPFKALAGRDSVARFQIRVSCKLYFIRNKKRKKATIPLRYTQDSKVNQPAERK